MVGIFNGFNNWDDFSWFGFFNILSGGVLVADASDWVEDNKLSIGCLMVAGALATPELFR